MKALTVQQPWAWAIIHGGKSVENRTQAWSYRGLLAIHAGARLSQRGLVEVDWRSRWTMPTGEDLVRGAIIGVVDLVDAHVAEVEHFGGHHVETACCRSPWAETSYVEHGGRTWRDLVHLVLENPRPLDVPIPCKGRLGLWTPPADVLDELQEAVR
ncbi:MAG: ASCH domain-containing protein [Actinobacteria bacterium]|nr:ASCH domain-containing protein [Actinomycetota bacterium]